MRGFVFLLVFGSNLLQAQSLSTNIIDEKASFFEFTKKNEFGDNLKKVKIEFNFEDENYLPLDKQVTLKNRKKKKRKKIAAIFCGIANAFTSIAQAVNGKPKEGITNLIGNAFNTAAQITQIDANYAKQFEFEETGLRSFLLFNPMLDLTEAIYTINSDQDAPELDLNRFPNIKELVLLATYSQRANWLARKILENFFVQGFLKEALDYIEVYLHSQVDKMLDFLRSNLLVNYRYE